MEPISGGYCCSSELRNNCDTKAVEFGTLDNSAFWQGGPFPECERERTVCQKSNTDRKWATFAHFPPLAHFSPFPIKRNLIYAEIFAGIWNSDIRGRTVAGPLALALTPSTRTAQSRLVRKRAT